MSSEVAGLAFLSLSSGRSSTPSPEQPGICCFKMPESKCQRMLVGEALAPCSQKESIVGEKSGVCERFRRHSVDGSLGKQDSSLPESSHYHPYRRQYSEGSIPEVEPFSCVTTAEEVEEQSPWTPLCTNRETSSFMGSQQPYDELETESEEASGYTTFNHQTYNSPLQQQLFSSRGISNVSHYFNQSLSSQTSPDSSAQTLYPKPVYSYSILIFLALRNSKTGSLPVSEIYSFMTEHFPYFKTAPDGWKNSVRHNLSLNKCFEKIENKNGSSSRKGCLWALNPAKVEKMQEELHKWRRKDPLTVRRSMARPEELERLLGERPEKVKSFGAHFSLSSSHNHSQSSRIGLHPIYGQQSVQDTSVLQQKPLFNCLPSQNVLQPPPYSDPSAFSYYSPISQLPCTGHPSSPGPACLDSPLPAHTPPNYSSTLQTGHGTAGSIQLLMEGEISNDIDALNPSLTDLQLNGNLWEALRNDSLTPDSLVVLEMPPAPTPQLGLGVYSLSAGEMETDDGVQGSMSEMYLTGPRTHMFSNVDNLASLLSSSGNTPIPLL